MDECEVRVVCLVNSDEVSNLSLRRLLRLKQGGWVDDWNPKWSIWNNRSISARVVFKVLLHVDELLFELLLAFLVLKIDFLPEFLFVRDFEAIFLLVVGDACLQSD